jgi:hypothetical protein
MNDGNPVTPAEESSQERLKLLREPVTDLVDVELTHAPLTREQWHRELESVGRTHAALLADERARTAAWRACASQLAEALEAQLRPVPDGEWTGQARRDVLRAALAEYRRLSGDTP